MAASTKRRRSNAEEDEIGGEGIAGQEGVRTPDPGTNAPAPGAEADAGASFAPNASVPVGNFSGKTAETTNAPAPISTISLNSSGTPTATETFASPDPVVRNTAPPPLASEPAPASATRVRRRNNERDNPPSSESSANAIPRTKKRPPAPPAPAKSKPLLAGSLTLGGILLLVALLDYKSNQYFYFSDPRGLLASLGAQFPLKGTNAIGGLGATFSILLFGLSGMGAFFVPTCLFIAAAYCMFHRAGKLFPWRVSYMLFSFLALVTLLARVAPAPLGGDNVLATLGFLDFVRMGLGGSLGNLLYENLLGALFGATGSLLLLVILYPFCLTGIFLDEPVWKLRHLVYQAGLSLRAFLFPPPPAPSRGSTKPLAFPRIATETAKMPPKTGSGTPQAAMPAISTSTAAVAAPANPPEIRFEDYSFAKNPEPASVNMFVAKVFAEPATGDTAPVPPPAALDAPSPPDDGAKENISPAPPPPALKPQTPPPPAAPAPAGSLRILGEEIIERASPMAVPEKKGAYQFPPVALLSEPPPHENTTQEDYAGRADRLLTTLSEFKIKAEMGDIQSGPVITRYEIIPAPGVKVEKIAGLANNLAMNLRAEAVRVLAPVPGKGTVGIEVPNLKAKAVSLREIIESKAWETTKAKIPVVLGKDVTGKPIIEDLAKMPHCLIAGSTGSGKSVCINGIIASLIYHAGPDELRFIMVDPKVVELQVFNKLPHMLIPVVTDPKKVPAALKYLIGEMGKRYKFFAKEGVRNIASFNQKIAKEQRRADERQFDLDLTPEERVAASNAIDSTSVDDVEVPKQRLPYIICFIDELADLMMVAPADIETGIARLAQLARAAGIHLILATQRPSVNVITGIIKANLPTRIAFRVTSLMDSRTILDQKGAETLIGKGDMLFIPPGGAHLVRAQGAFVSEEEIEKLVDHVALCNGEPEFDDEAQEIIDRIAAEECEEDDDNAPTEGTGEFEGEDPMLSKAWNLINATKKASTSFLQRKLSIGYGRAAKIMDTLESRGYIGPDKGPGAPRDILRE
ncbi:MAG: DNA translocase FtsK 4TM domain-containing protein [Puniceicoccales bacterium]|nr:DNA translocase FtsK 4TM domain-containing protein [Puniceicoccales bacterium]